MAGRSVCGALQGPALGASVPMIVPRKHLVRANDLSRTLRSAINLIGPPSGAFLMEVMPMHWVLSVDIITAVIAVAV